MKIRILSLLTALLVLMTEAKFVQAAGQAAEQPASFRSAAQAPQAPTVQPPEAGGGAAAKGTKDAAEKNNSFGSCDLAFFFAFNLCGQKMIEELNRDCPAGHSFDSKNWTSEERWGALQAQAVLNGETNLLSQDEGFFLATLEGFLPAGQEYKGEQVKNPHVASERKDGEISTVAVVTAKVSSDWASEGRRTTTSPKGAPLGSFDAARAEQPYYMSVFSADKNNQMYSLNLEKRAELKAQGISLADKALVKKTKQEGIYWVSVPAQIAPQLLANPENKDFLALGDTINKAVQAAQKDLRAVVAATHIWEPTLKLEGKNDYPFAKDLTHSVVPGLGVKVEEASIKYQVSSDHLGGVAEAQAVVEMITYRSMSAYEPPPPSYFFDQKSGMLTLVCKEGLDKPLMWFYAPSAALGADTKPADLAPADAYKWQAEPIIEEGAVELWGTVE